MSGSNDNSPIKDHREPEVFLALKRICQYVVDDAWNTSVGFDEVDAEYNLAVAKTKRHKDDVIKLANLDTDLTWGDVKEDLGKGKFITRHEGDFNPWYDGDLTLEQLLNSMEGLAEFLEFSTPRRMEEAEYLHFFNYLRYILIPANELKKAPVKSIAFDNLHPKIQEHCRNRFNSKNYSDAIFAAYKVIFIEIKKITGIRNSDGKKLAEKVFNIGNPIIKLNDLESESDRDEQNGFMLLVSGAALGIRNPKAHDLVEQNDLIRTLEYLSFASLLLTRIDERKELDLAAVHKKSPTESNSKETNNNNEELPYVYIQGSFGGNGHIMGFRACTTNNLSDNFMFIEKIKVLDATIPFDNTLIKPGESLQHTGIDGLSYPASDDPKQTVKIYFHARNKEQFVSTQKLKFQKRADGKFNIVGIEDPVISRARVKS